MKSELRDRILALREKNPRQLFTLKELVRRLQVEAQDRRALLAVLEELEQAGLIYHLKRSKFGFTSAQRTITGRLQVHPRGFGFVKPDSGGSSDVYIAPRALGAAVHGDRVVIEVQRRISPAARPHRAGRRKPRSTKSETRDAAEAPERASGRVVQVLERAGSRVVGRLLADRQWVFLQPLDDRLQYIVRLAEAPTGDWREGAIAEVDILVHPGRNHPALGRLRKILGYPGDKDLALRITLCKHGIPTEFPPEVLAEAAGIDCGVSAGERTDRRDLRDWVTVTIDPETARDVDDAVNVRRLLDGSFLLGVHIADVAHYVREGGALDREALARGNSYYFPDRAVPMLPEPLSSGICSLNPGVDRLAFSVLMHLGEGGELQRREFARTIIRSRAKLTYTEVGRILIERDPEISQRHAELVPMLEDMRRICEILLAKRRARGAIDLDLPEAEVVLDSNGEVVDVVRAERHIAHKIIEEFMLLANETVAAHLSRQPRPTLYRVHEPPEPEKIREYAQIVRSFGFTLAHADGIPAPADFQRLSDELGRRPDAQFLHYLMLRSFTQARYCEENFGHFGLASAEYTHFTSPIRRYADLVVHRLLEASLQGEKELSEVRREAEVGRIRDVALQTSRQERIAAEAERDMVDHYRAVLMSRCLGDEFEGFICNVVGGGFFVQLERHFVEGFVPGSSLEDDYYVYRPEMRALVGRRSRRMFRLGDRIRVLIDSVDIDARRVQCSLADD